jgi:hypothetical protein
MQPIEYTRNAPGCQALLDFRGVQEYNVKRKGVDMVCLRLKALGAEEGS